MTLRPLTRAESRSIDASAAALGLPTTLLMENAGRGAAGWLRTRLEILRLELARAPRVLVACGPGNNGGDGAVVARHLDGQGVQVEVAWSASPAQLRGDAAFQHAVLYASGITQNFYPTTPWSRFEESLARADWVVDALLGTGLARPVEGLLADAIQAVEEARKPVLALDIPSGLDADTGLPLGRALHATATATFAARKIGFENPAAAAYLGEVFVVDLGLPLCILWPFLGPADVLPTAFNVP